ncbi:MAG TPA: NYN domain-containing protein [Candidatus Moranbacteria bacterium]|jgi:uncharacterized LabA/DUF88 family protein|nr:NYN domain-containing protein [Candidatus Moranbacteria bacterium]HOF42507.1 NYN domain-containing protein [Candidatus Moranbacteria bacterium]HPX94304.1 NYN domain-containing protein [Candidatus Moranbacteria bacterium]HQB59582.1 NYN domain-containing protein [Candidatus Moranbacteria bacterium]
MSTTNSCVFIDTANINASFRKIKSKLGLSDKIKLDFDNLIKIITVGSNLVSKSIYVESRSSDDGSRKFIDFLKHRGFNVITKEIKVISLDNGDKKNKANFDAEIAYDICQSVWKRECNKVFLFSGDSDFAYVTRQIKNLGITVVVISSKNSLSRELLELADNVVYLEDLLTNEHNITFSKQS